MNAYQFLSKFSIIKYHHLIAAKRYDGWQWAVDAYCPKDVKGKLWMVYLDVVINHEEIIYEEWRHNMRHKLIVIKPYDANDEMRFIRCDYLADFNKILKGN